MAVVTTLRRGKRSARGPAETAVALALEAGEIEQRRRRLARRATGLPGGAGLTAHRGRDFLGPGLVEDAVFLEGLVLAGLECRIEPRAGVAGAVVVEDGRHPPVRARNVRQNLEFLIDEHRERRSLHATRGPRGLLLAALEPLGERTRRVHSDHPVRLGATCG